MIKEKQPLNMYEATEILGSLKEMDKVKEARDFIKRFGKISATKAKKLKKELEKLDLLRLKKAGISKIIDIMPEDAAELNKIFTEVTLDADETNRVLETIKQNK